MNYKLWIVLIFCVFISLVIFGINNNAKASIDNQSTTVSKNEKSIIDKDAVVKGTTLTRLQFASNYANYESVEALIKEGVNLDIKDSESGKTALMYAFGFSLDSKIQKNKNKIVKLLIKSNADLEITDNLGATALHWAVAVFPKTNLIELLLKKGAKVNVVDKDGITPLSIVISAKNEQLIKLLKSYDAKLNSLEEANLAFHNNHYKKALKLYEKACSLHQAIGCAGAATIYIKGIGIDKNITKAMKLYEKACDYNDELSCVKIGMQYYLGEHNITRDLHRAKAFFKKACDSNDTRGCTAYGIVNKELLKIK